jgi:hypothetical protein
MAETKIADFSTAKCDIQYEYVYLTGTITHPELEWHFEGDDTCTIISQHEMMVKNMYLSGDKHYITLRMSMTSLTATIPDMGESALKIVQGGKSQSIDALLGDAFMILLSTAGSMQYSGTGKASTLEFGAQVTPEVNSAATSNPIISLLAEYDYTHPFIIKAPYGHRLELQLAHPDLEIRTILKYKPAWHNNEEPQPIFVKDVNLADTQIAANLLYQIGWVAGEVNPEIMITTGASGVLYWLTLSQEGRAKLKQETIYNAPLTVRDVTAGVTLQVPLLIGAITE